MIGIKPQPYNQELRVALDLAREAGAASDVCEMLELMVEARDPAHAASITEALEAAYVVRRVQDCSGLAKVAGPPSADRSN